MKHGCLVALGSLAAMQCLLFSVAVSAAEPWSRFRGPRGDGVAAMASAPLEWSATKNVNWKTELPGEGWSSPVVRGRTIFLTAAVPVSAGSEDFSLRLLRIDTQRGRIEQQTEIFQQPGATAPGIHSKNSHASPTPLIEGQRIYVHFGHQGTAALDLNGKILWRNRELEYFPVHGNGGSPIIVDKALIFSCDGRDEPFVVALDKDTGRVLWKTARVTDASKKFSFSTPTVIEVDDKWQVISPGSNTVGAFDPQSGREIWRVRYDGYSVIPKPVVGDGLVFISTGYNRPQLLAIRPSGQGDVTASHVVWRADRGAPHTPSPVYYEGFLYVVSDGGVASCLEARTGDMRWQKRLGGDFSASPLVADGKVYFSSEEGVTTVVAAAPDYQQLAKNELGQPTLASFAVVDNDFLIRGETHLFRITARP